MIRISSLVGGSVGFLGGAFVSREFDATPSNFLAVGAVAAVGIGAVVSGLWCKFGQGYLAEYIAKQVDDVISKNKESIKELVKSKLPPLVTSISNVDSTIASVLDKSLDGYKVNRELVYGILDDMDRCVPYESSLLFEKFVQTATNSVIQAKFSGYWRPLQSLLRKPLDRVIATVAANILHQTVTSVCTSLNVPPPQFLKEALGGNFIAILAAASSLKGYL